MVALMSMAELVAAVTTQAELPAGLVVALG